MDPDLHLVPVPGGTLAMRDARSRTSREVEVRPFELGCTPVTVEQYDAVRGAAGPATGSGRRPAHPVSWFAAVAWCNAASAAAGLRPAYRLGGRDVGWDVSAQGYRLPTEAEWEWACRAGTTGPVHGPLPEIAWTAADRVEGPQDVALKAANAWGLHDTIGNVWEWCWDFADTARYLDYRSLRGGGWDDAAWSCRASVRRGSAPDAVLEDVGFRAARGAVGRPGAAAAQGWSAEADWRRADVRGPLPPGWTPLRSLLQ